MVKTIFVCSAGILRSGAAKAVVDYEARQRGIDYLVTENASLNAANILANNSPLERQLKILEAGLHFGLVRYNIWKRVEDIVGLGTKQELTDEIRALYADVRPLFHGLQVAHRNQALKEVGIECNLPPYTPFNAGGNYNFVIVMAEKDVKKAQAMVRQGTATITSYGALINQNDPKDDLLSGLEGAREVVQYFMSTRSRAVEALLR
ncbi:hypothetical protein J4401_04905 [Candidatus Woesearchaeota archaeon]|nr:hypothetical protein [Candidatus Woesearchaeota archaeon]